MIRKFHLEKQGAKVAFRVKEGGFIESGGLKENGCNEGLHHLVNPNAKSGNHPNKLLFEMVDL